MSHFRFELDASGCTHIGQAIVRYYTDRIAEDMEEFILGGGEPTWRGRTLEEVVRSCFRSALEIDIENGEPAAEAAGAPVYVQMANVGWELYVNSGDMDHDVRYVVEANADRFGKPIDWDAKPRRDLGGAVRRPRTADNRRQGTDAMKARSKTARPKAKAPAKKASKPKSKGVRR